MAKKTKKQKELNKLISTVAFCLFFLLLCFLYYKFSPSLSNNSGDNLGSFPIVLQGEEIEDLCVHFIDVGQGDAIFIETPDKTTILIDAGDGTKDNNASLIGYLDALNVKTINYFVATHSDKDHIGGSSVIFDNYTVEFVYRPYICSKNEISQKLTEAFNPVTPTIATSNVYANFLLNTKNEKADWAFFTQETDLVINYGADGEDQLIFDFLTPTSSLNSIQYSDVNSYSPIIMLTYRGVNFMFTGDADKTVENELIDNYSASEIDCDVLKVGHHGSDTSSTLSFINSVSPEISIISCGNSNSYKHPKQSVINNLVSVGSLLYRTDLQGNIVASVSSTGSLKIVTEILYDGSNLYIGY